MRADAGAAAAAPAVAPLTGSIDAENPASVYAADVMTIPASLAGLPAIAIPYGRDAATGLPLSVQLIAARGREALLLRVAEQLERQRELDARS